MPRIDGEYQVPFPDVVPDTTIESVVHNGIVHDLVFDANFPRPITAGGTGGVSPTEARGNLSVEVRGVVVTNYDDHVFEVGSYFSAVAATAAPNATDPFVGICLRHSVSGDLWLSAVSQTTGVTYTRRRTAGVWGAWVTSNSVALPFVPAGDITATTVQGAIEEVDAELHAEVARLDAEKASVTYVQSVGFAAYDGMAYLGMQVNGSFIINQDRAVGTTNTLPGTVRITDCWKAEHGSNGRSVILDSGLGMNSYQFNNFSSAPALALGDTIRLYTNIEGNRFAGVGWGAGGTQSPITISFRADHTYPGLYAVAVRNAANSRSYVATYNYTVGGYYTITIPPDPAIATWNRDDTIGLNISFGIRVGAGNQAPAANTWQSGVFLTAPGCIDAVPDLFAAFRLRSVTVMAGSAGPPADRVQYLARPYTEELALCQRYFQVMSGGTNIASGIATAAAAAKFPVRFNMPMRAAPVMTTGAAANFFVIDAGGSHAVSAITASGSTVGGAQLDATTSGLVAGQAVMLSMNVGSPVYWNAEL